MFFDKMFDALTDSTEKLLEKEATVRGLDYSEVKKDADSGLVIDGCSFGSKYAIVRNGKKSVLLPYKELFWVFTHETDSADRVNVYFVTVYHIMYQINNMRMTDVIDICKRIKAADMAVQIGFSEHYAKLYDEHPDELREIKRQYLIMSVYNELKKDAEERKASGEQEPKPAEEAPVQQEAPAEKASEPVQEKAPEPVHEPVCEEENEKAPDKYDEIQERFMEAYNRLCDEDDDDIPLRTEKAICEAAPEIGEQMKKFRRNAIYLCDKDTPEGGIPVGASKVGGMPDLPPDIEYPTMTGFTFRRKGQKPEEARVYPKTAMHLVMQINLYELAESGADKEDIFPKTGMLYLFWSGEMDDTVFDPENKYSFVRTDEPELSRVSKLIWWDGDISVLRRTEPTLPYYEDADDEDNGKFDDICPEKMISFADMTEYSREELMSIKGFSEIDARNDLELSDHGNKLLGVPWGCNIPYIEEDEIQLLQLRYSVGCVWSLFWIMKKQDFIDRDFTNIHLDADCD